MVAFHTAVIESEGVDFYTGERLAWEQISTYRNEESKKRGREYIAMPFRVSSETRRSAKLGDRTDASGQER